MVSIALVDGVQMRNLFSATCVLLFMASPTFAASDCQVVKDAMRDFLREHPDEEAGTLEFIRKNCGAAGARNRALLRAIQQQQGQETKDDKQQKRWCESKGDVFPPDLRINGCTALIQSERYTGRNLAVTYNNRGNAYFLKKQYDNAIADYDLAIQIYPDIDGANNNRAKAYLKIGEHDRALADFDLVIRRFPRVARKFQAYAYRGDAYLAKGDYDHAIEDYNKALKLNPKDAFAYKSRGAAYYLKENYDRAIQDYDHAVKLNPSDAETFVNRGLAYGKKGENIRAIADANEAIRLDPRSDGGYIVRGSAFSEIGEYDSALEDYNHAIQLASDLERIKNVRRYIADVQQRLAVKPQSHFNGLADRPAWIPKIGILTDHPFYMEFMKRLDPREWTKNELASWNSILCFSTITADLAKRSKSCGY